MAHLSELAKTADELCVLHRCNEAVAFWEEASSVTPDDANFHYHLAVCYSRDCHAQGLQDPLVAIYNYRRALALMPKENVLARATLLGDLGNTYLLAALPSKVSLFTSIDCFQQAAEIYRESGRLDDWAREQHNLGSTWCEMPETEFPSKWEEAIGHFEQALSIRTREKDRERHAATLQNLGTAYRELKTGNRAGNIRRALHCYCETMRVLRASVASRRWAALHHDLGNAYLTLAFTGESRSRNTRRAIRHLNRALTVRTKIQSPFDYAATQLSRGEAFLQMAVAGVGDPCSRNKARACFQEAEDSFTQAGRMDLAEATRERRQRVGAGEGLAAPVQSEGPRSPSPDLEEELQLH
jgi:tetratricopeptide (TPR) repeat protein